MSLNLSIKNVPDATAQRLRARAERNHRSLQGELMAILEAAAALDAAPQHPAVAPRAVDTQALALMPSSHLPSPVAALSLDEIVERARGRFPQGTAHLGRSVDIIREMRDQRDGDRTQR